MVQRNFCPGRKCGGKPSRTPSPPLLFTEAGLHDPRRGKAGSLPEGEALRSYLGEIYKDLVNTILQRYKMGKVIIENLF